MIGSVPEVLSDEAGKACVLTSRDGFPLVIEPVVDSDSCGAGCGCSDLWECPLWCWRKWLGSFALVVAVLAAVALPIDSGIVDAGFGCPGS